jgi:uncharacterized repeat protein (TIGR03806 family)
MLEGTGATAKSILLNSGGPKPLIPSLGEDGDGELYVVGFDTGILYKITQGDPSGAPLFPDLLSQTGCVDPSDATHMAAGLVPYGTNVQLWSDGADKRRFLAIPDGTTVKVDPTSGDFELPEGSVAVKEFAIDGKRIETRLLRRHPGGEWTATTYEWNDAQTDAVLLEHAKEKVLPNGQTWTFPGQIQCFQCHTDVAGRSLGLETLQLNGDFQYGPGQNENQVTKLSAIGYFDHSLDAATLPRLPHIDDTTAPVEDRARAYLHANCSYCHRASGPTESLMDLRFGLPLAAVKSCQPALSYDVADTKIIAPGDPQHSALYLRMSELNSLSMPPLGKRKVDTAALAVMESWIRGRTTCE